MTDVGFNRTPVVINLENVRDPFVRHSGLHGRPIRLTFYLIYYILYVCVHRNTICCIFMHHRYRP